jgi:iron complex outermembrane receptor protein
VAAPAFAQTAATIAGSVKSKDNNEALVGATVTVLGTGRGAACDINGKFKITNVPSGAQKVRVVYVGYKEQIREITLAAGETATLDVLLEATSIIGDMIVVSASRKAEKVTQAPSTISIIDAKGIENLASFNPAELLGRLKGVDYVRSGVAGIGINVRGFNSAFNPKNLQMNDARISTLVATGLPFGSLSTTVKDDIERVEVVLGPTAALYGPNAHNGLVNTLSKDPRTSQGTTVAIGGGNQSVYTWRARIAQAFDEHVAFKMSVEYDRGKEFNYVDTVYNGAGTIAWPELDLNLDFYSFRGEAAVYISPTIDNDIILAYGRSTSSNIGVTNAGRNQIQDWGIEFIQARYVSPHFFAQLYNTWSSTDSTYAINQRTQNYQSFKLAGFSEEESRQRSFKEQWFAPLRIAFNRGALFIDDSKRLNAEAQYNNDFGFMNLILGVQHQRDNANSKGTYLLDNNGGGIIVNQTGFYGQLEVPFGESGFKAVAAARADRHDLYGSNFIPKAALVYHSPLGALRATYGKGIAAPTILNLEANIFGGLLLGNSQGFTVKELNRQTNQIVGQYEVAKQVVEKIQSFEVGYKGTIAGNFYLDANAYYNTSEDFLSPAINIAPDRDPTFDHDNNPATPPVNRIVGYAVQRGGQPVSELTTTAALPDGSRGADLVLTYVNFGKVKTYGADFGVNYYLSENVSIAANYSYFNFSLDKNDLKNDADRNGKVLDNDLPINTPKHKGGLGLNVAYDQVFGSVFARWTDKYDFISGINVAAKANPELLTGNAPTGLKENARFGRTFNYGPLGGFVSVDLGLGYRITPKITVSASVSNLFDSKKVREFVASPAIGRLIGTEVKFNL